MASKQKRPLRVLLVEDQENDEVLLRRTLSGAFDLMMHRVDTAEAMHRALSASADWDVVISDYAMPSFSAFGALAVLREDGRDLPFIILSGTITDETAVSAMRAGAHDYVMKHNLHRLRPAIERELEEAEHRRARRAAEAERDRLLAREREWREAAEAAARLKDEFLNVLSHELRTPLTSILGWTRTLRLREAGNPAVRQTVEAIERNGRTLTRLVDDLLDLSALLSGRLLLDEHLVDFSALVRAAADDVAEAACGKQVSVDVAVAPDCCVYGDRRRLHQVVAYLLMNAVKFTPANGRIWVALERSDSELKLSIRDTGVGIPTGFLPHVFDSFRQADSSVTRAFGGLGLGLALVRRLTEMHGGHVEADSPGAGEGAVFTVQLPLAAARSPSPELWRVAQDRRALAGRIVLLVDDDAADRERARSALETCGAAVVAVPAADAALDALNWTHPDVVIVDLELSLRNGHEVIRKIRQLRKASDVPVLALGRRTGVSGLALAAGFNAVVERPLTREWIVGAVLDLLQHAARH